MRFDRIDGARYGVSKYYPIIKMSAILCLFY